MLRTTHFLHKFGKWLLLAAALAGVLAPLSVRAGDARQQLLDHARGKAQRDLQSLESFLTKGGPGVLAGWQQHLCLDELKAELAADQPNSDRLTLLRNPFYAPVDGLEGERFLQLRESVREYQLLLATPHGDLREAQAKAVEQLHAHVANYRATDQREDAHAIGRKLAWLSATGGDQAVVDSVRKEFNQPNAHARISSRLANYFLTRPVVERDRVSTTINGTHTSGDAETRATLWLKTSPAKEFGAFDICLTGQTTTSNSVSNHGPVTLFGSAVTSIDARVRLTVHDNELRVEKPVVHCVTNSDISNIEAKRRIVERMAWRRVPKETPAAEQAAARHIEQQLSERLGTETKKLIAQANDMYLAKVRSPMLRRGGWPKLQYSTDNNSLNVRFYQADKYQVAAPNQPPQWPVEGDLTLAGHESMWENMFEGIFAGQEVRDTRFLYLQEVMTGESPRALWVHDREPRWSVVMAAERPLRLRMREGQLQVTLALAETRQGEQTYKLPALVTGTFTAEATPDGPVFYRQGDISVEFPEREVSSENAEELRGLLMRKFAAVMPEELHFDGLSAPAGGFGDKINQLVAREISFSQGWVTLRYQLDLDRAPKTELVTTSPIPARK